MANRRPLHKTIMACGPPADYTPWLGHWMQSRFEEEVFEAVLAKKGFPYPLRRLMTNFVAERKFFLDGDRFMLTTKMLGFDTIKKFWNTCPMNEPTSFSVLGYSIVATLTWEDDGNTFVSTTVTTSEEGYVLSGWTTTTRMTHRIEPNGEMAVTTIEPNGDRYTNWLTKVQ